MKKTRTKTLATTGLILLLTFISVFAIMLSANAQVLEIDTYLHVMVAPNPVGVNQWVQVTIQLDKVSPTALGIYGGDHFANFTVEINKPDQDVDNMGPYTAWATSGFFFIYTPNQIGTYTLQANFPGQWINTTDRDNYFKPATSKEVELIVQPDPIPDYPDTVMSQDEYWERPISAENKGWWRGADNWLMQDYDKTSRSFCVSTAFAPYTAAPDSAHILWKKPIIFGGIAGGKYVDMSYYTGLSYEQFYLPLILEGRIYYVEHGPATGNAYGTRVLDLYTGEEILFLNNTSIDLIQIYDIENPNEHGLIAHLWDTSGSSTNTTAEIYDAFTGRHIFTITNITWGGFGMFSGGSTVFGPQGEILSYRLDTQNGSRMILWNSSKAIHTAFPWIGGEIGEIYSPGYGAVIDGQLGIQYNVSIPDVPPGAGISTVDEGYILVQSRDTSSYPYVYTDRAYDAETGEELWVKNRTEIFSNFFRRPMNIGDGVYVMHDESKLEHHGYDIETGNRLWTTVPNPTGWGIFTYQQHVAYGKLYTTGYEGEVRAYNIENGELNWTYYLGNAGYETPYGSWATYNGFTIADGKMFVGADEHSPNSVLWRGAKLWAIDAETGDGVWSVSGMFRNPAISDGILTALNSYDGQVYTFGKGPSKTTVSAPDIEVPKGNSVLIKGSVLDMSPGQPESPCISDNDMSAWMEYMHMQKKRPENATGVPVKLAYQLPDGSWKDIDQVISDDHGNFGFKWTPEEEGTYLVKAFFLGSESYAGSSATTYLTVGPASADSGYQGPSADEIAQATVNKLPPYPDVPSASEVAQETINRIPAYPTVPSATEIAQETADRIPEAAMPAYLTIDLVILVIVAIGVVIGLLAYMALRKQ